jgi:7-carboxy-7-deazaguanine synthase
MTKLKIANIFLTLDGECTWGGPLQYSTFIRTGGCNLRCWKSSGYCDAPGTLDINYPYQELSIPEIVSRVIGNLPCKRVTITGGEPLLQKKEVCELAKELQQIKYHVSLETSGSIDLSQYSTNYFNSIIADLKPPSTEMDKRNCKGLFKKLGSQDFIKVVIQNREDYDWALSYIYNLQLSEYSEHTTPNIAFGPRWGFLEPRELESWLRRDKRFNIRLNLQLHKYIWPESITPLTQDLKVLNREELLRNER